MARGFLPLTFRAQSDSEIAVRSGESRVDAQHSLPVLHRFWHLTLFRKRHAQLWSARRHNPG
jgi:hypothetical protein